MTTPLDLKKHLSQRAQRVMGTLGKQISVPIGALTKASPEFEQGLERLAAFVRSLT